MRLPMRLPMRQNSRNRIPLRRAMLVLTGFALGAQAAAASESVAGAAPGSCITLDEDFSGPLQLAQASPTRPGLPPGRLPGKRPVRQPPLTERELNQLISALEPIRLMEQAGHRVQAFDRRPLLPPARMQSIIEDVTAHLALINLVEQLDRFRELPELPELQLEWGEGVLQALNECLESRYAGHGGASSRQTTHRLVLAQRKTLEDRLFRPIIEYRAGEREKKE